MDYFYAKAVETFGRIDFAVNAEDYANSTVHEVHDGNHSAETALAYQKILKKVRTQNNLA